MSSSQSANISHFNDFCVSFMESLILEILEMLAVEYYFSWEEICYICYAVEYYLNYVNEYYICLCCLFNNVRMCI